MKNTSPQIALLAFPRSHVEVICRHAKGNHAARRMLALFESAGTGRLQATPAFRAQWLSLVARAPGDAENLAYRMSKLSNRPLGEQCPGSASVCNNWIYHPDSFKRAMRTA